VQGPVAVARSPLDQPPARLATEITSITILGGRGKLGDPEPIRRIDLQMGQVISVVGPTGSGKTTLINDLELFADGTTPTGRRILTDGEVPPAEYRDDPSRHPIALITQHTTFLSDLPVREFITTHAQIRQNDASRIQATLAATLVFANELTGEPIPPDSRMTELSGGQARALMIADATIVCETPIVLLDEVENAGIHRTRALELLRAHRKIFIFVTHDPRIALLSDHRIVMQNGSMTHLLETDEQEREVSLRVNQLDDRLASLRDRLRSGQRLTVREVDGWT
jgi:ABC-type lipoprotein export system ATPase subunit